MTQPSASAPAARGIAAGPGVARRLVARRGRAILAAGAAGALTVIDPASLGTLQRSALRLAEAALAGLIVTDTGEDPIIDPASDGLLTAGLVLGLAELSEALDGRVTRALRDAGMPQPRLLLAGLGVAAVASLYALGARPEESTGADPLEESVELPHLEPLEPRARALIGALLDAGEAHRGTAALREQLDVARSLRLGTASPDVVLSVPAAERLAVPHEQTWPVRGRFRHEGFAYMVELQIESGRLSALTVQVAPEERHVQPALDALYGADLPSIQDVETMIESETPSPRRAA